MEKDNIVDLITCPVCFELSRPPIWQCANGHVVCDSCTKALKKRAAKTRDDPACPVCRIICKAWSRNLSLEKMATMALPGHTYPCPNECGVTLNYENGNGHVAHCRATGIPCLVEDCVKKVPRAWLANHVLTTHESQITPIHVQIGGTYSLGSQEPTKYVPFASKESLMRCYILVVSRGDMQVASWLLVKRHRKSHIEVGIECIHVHENYKNLSYTISATNTAGSCLALIITSTNLRIRDDTQKGVVIKNIPAHEMSMFHVSEESQGTLQITVEEEANNHDSDSDEPPRKRTRTTDKV